MIPTLIGALVLLLGATAITMRRADVRTARHALGPADDLTGWPEQLAEINAERRAAARAVHTERFEPVSAWTVPEDLPVAMVRPYYLHHLEVSRGDA